MLCRRNTCAPVAAVKYNPQNVDDPVVMPSPNFSATECVKAQLDCLMNNDEPWCGSRVHLHVTRYPWLERDSCTVIPALMHCQTGQTMGYSAHLSLG